MLLEGTKINGVTSDSRKVKEGFIFVAIQGDKLDGNSFIEDAVARGASIVFTEKDITRTDCIIKKTDDCRKKLAELCNEFYDYPSEKLIVVGVTGTNGKTTTTHLIHEIILKHGISAGLIGTLSIKLNDREYNPQLTTPIAEDIYFYLSEMVKNNVKVVVMEVSSHGLKSYRVFGIDFDIAIHTNIDRDHLNFHKTMEDYILSKKKLFDNLSDGKLALINVDDQNCIRLLEGNKNMVVVTYGLNEKASVTASSIDTEFPCYFNYCLQRGLTTISGIDIEPFEYPMQINLYGTHNVYNALAAVTCCLLLDVPIQSIARVLKKAKAVPRRMELIYEKDFSVIDDFSHNPASYEAVLSSIQGLPYKNIFIVNAIRGNRGLLINTENAEVLMQWAQILRVKDLVITSSSEFVSSADKVTNQEREVFLDILYKANVLYKYEERLSDAIQRALSQMQEGDFLLLLGAQGMKEGKRICLEMLKDSRYINPSGEKIAQQASKAKKSN